MNEQQLKKLERLAVARKQAQERITAEQQQLNSRFHALEQKMLHAEAAPTETQQKIITAALELLDEEGLNELSLRKLAPKVGLKAPALYWHFTNKEELIDYMAEAILAQEFSDLTVRPEGESWQDWLVGICTRLRAAMLSHRDGARIVAGAHLYPAVTLARLMEVAGESLGSAGISDEYVDLIVGTAVHFTFGRVIEEQSSPSFAELQAIDIDVIADAFPRMARNIERIKNTGAITGFGDDNFERSLRLIIR